MFEVPRFSAAPSSDGARHLAERLAAARLRAAAAAAEGGDGGAAAATTALRRQLCTGATAARPSKRARPPTRQLLRELIKQARREALWYPPGVEPPEDPRAAARRKRREERAAGDGTGPPRLLPYFAPERRSELEAGSTASARARGEAGVAVDDASPPAPAELHALGFARLTPIQAAVRAAFRSTPHSRDLLVSAPTGTGKTLAYLLPLAEALTGRRVVAVRALVIVPTRDLAAQVHAVAEAVLGARGLTAALAAGATPFDDETSAISSTRRPTWMVRAGACAGGPGESGSAVEEASCDVVVATPGRLMLHLSRGTLSVAHLRYLVVDEADRMLRQQYNEFAPAVGRALAMAAARPAPQVGCRGADPGVRKLLLSATISRDASKLARLDLRQPMHVTVNATPLAAAVLVKAAEAERGEVEADAAEPESEPARGVDEAMELDYNRLHEGEDADSDGGEEPRAVEEDGGEGTGAAANTAAAAARDEVAEEAAEAEEAARRRHTLPPLLEHWRVEARAGERPLVLARLLSYVAGCDATAQTIVFVSSVEMAHRLTVLLALMARARPELRAAEYSSRLSQRERAAALRSFRRREVGCLIASDAATRGLDVSGVGVVVNYNAPAHAKTYVHRVGRTARNGARGAAFSLLEQQEQFHFKRMLSKLGCVSQTFYLRIEDSQGVRAKRVAGDGAPEADEAGDDAAGDTVIGGGESAARERDAAGGSGCDNGDEDDERDDLRVTYAAALGELKGALDSEVATDKRAPKRLKAGTA